MRWHRCPALPSAQVDVFLLTNCLGCLVVTDVVRVLGLRKVVVGGVALMALGCLLRSGIPFAGGLPPYPLELLGTVLVGAAQPFFQVRSQAAAGGRGGEGGGAIKNLSTQITLVR